MSYSGFLIKIGDYKIPHNMIRAETYQVYRSVQDLDSYSDANGKLHRNALEHVPCKCEFETKPMLTNKEFASFMGKIQAQYTNTLERKGTVTLYIPETDSYVTQDMYMPDIQPTIYSVIDDVIRYEQIRLAFIGY